MNGGNENTDFLVRKWLTQSAGGSSFGDVLLPPSARLRRIYIHSADLVDGHQFEYTMPGGGCGLSRFAGGVGGWRRSFELPEGEVLKAISGSFGKFLTSIRFHTVSAHSPEYGVATGERFYFEFSGDLKFRGIFGREGLYVDSLGVVLEATSCEEVAAVANWTPQRSCGIIHGLPARKEAAALAGPGRKAA